MKINNLNKEELTHKYISIYSKNSMEIVNHTMKSKWINTIGKDFSSAHLINPTQMYRNIRCTVTICQYNLASINPKKSPTNKHQKHKLYWFLHNIFVKKPHKKSTSRFNPSPQISNGRSDTQASIGQPAKYFFTLCKFPFQ